jgi:hypothetical protein
LQEASLLLLSFHSFLFGFAAAERTTMIDSLPPNDPSRNGSHNNNNNNNNNNSSSQGGKQQDPREGSDERPMEVFGNLGQDAPAVIALFLISVATWFLRERCIC